MKKWLAAIALLPPASSLLAHWNNSTPKYVLLPAPVEHNTRIDMQHASLAALHAAPTLHHLPMSESATENASRLPPLESLSSPAASLLADRKLRYPVSADSGFASG